MYIHIGSGRLVRDHEIIGVFDMDGKYLSDTTVDFLKKLESESKTSSAGDDIPRCFVLTDSGAVFTRISADAVGKRERRY